MASPCLMEDKRPMRGKPCLVVAAILVGCTQDDSKLAAKTASLEVEVATLQKSLKDITASHQQLQKDVGMIKFEKLLEKSDFAAFDATNKGYGKIEHNNGFFLVTLVDVKPKADGQLLTFNFGNPFAAEYSGVKFKVRWKPRMPRNLEGDALLKAMAENERETQEMDVTLTDRIAAGAWNPVTFTIAPAPAEKAAIIEIKDIYTDQLRLRVGR